MIDLADAGVESPHAAKTGSESNLAHRQTGFVNELFGKLQPARLRHGAGCCSQVAQEQAAKMARANTQALGKHLHPAIFQAALTDQPQGTGDRVRSSQPCRGSR